MFKSRRSLGTRLLSGILLLTGVCCVMAAPPKKGVNSADPYIDGVEYVTLKAPWQRYGKKGKVEVVEVFSYTCNHCYHFEPYARKLRQSLPKGVVFRWLPATGFNPIWSLYAKAYHAASKLGVAQKKHQALFTKLHAYHQPLDSLDALADFYMDSAYGRANFLKIARSRQTAETLAKDYALLLKWGGTGVPTIVIDGKYRSNRISSYDQLVRLAKWLVRRELGDKKGS